MVGDGHIEVSPADDRRDGFCAAATEKAVLVGDAEVLRHGFALQPVVAFGQVGEGLMYFHRCILPRSAPPSVPAGLAELGGGALVAFLEGSCLHLPAIGLLACKRWVRGLLAGAGEGQVLLHQRLQAVVCVYHAAGSLCLVQGVEPAEHLVVIGTGPLLNGFQRSGDDGHFGFSAYSSEVFVEDALVGTFRQVVVEVRIIGVEGFLCFGSEPYLLDAVGEGLFAGGKELAELQSVYLCLGVERSAGENAFVVGVGIESEGVDVPLGIVGGSGYALAERCSVGGEEEGQVVSAVTRSDAEDVVLSGVEVDDSLDGSSSIGSAAAMRLQVRSFAIASVAYDLELRLGKRHAGSARPAGEAEVEVAIRKHIAACKVELAVYLEGIAQQQVVGRVVFLAVEVDEVKAVRHVLVGIVYVIGVVCGNLLLRNRVEHYPSAYAVLHLHLHELVVLAVGIVPREPGLARREHLLRELRRPVLRRRGRNEVVLSVVAQPCVDAGIVLSGFRETAVLVELRRVAFEVPIVIALDAVVPVQHGADALEHFCILCFADAAGKGPVAVPRSAPHPFGNPDGPSR